MPEAPIGDVDRIGRYGRAYREAYGFEAVLVTCRQRLLGDIVRDLRPRRVLEVGCGVDLLAEHVISLEQDFPTGPLFERWVTIEPDRVFGDRMEALSTMEPRCSIVRGLLEDTTAEAISTCGAVPDLIICASLLHEVPDPDRFLRAIRRCAGESSVVHFSVPNALSLHRRLARSMGLIRRESELSGRDQLFGHSRVYDKESLAEEVRSAGFAIVGSGGSFLKLFDHEHMEQIGFLTQDMILGLDLLGRELPEVAAEIFVNAVLAPSKG